MDKLINLVNGIPLLILVGAGVLIIVVIAALIVSTMYRKKIKNFVKYLEEALGNDNFSNELYSPAFIKRHSHKVENFANRTDSRIIQLTGLDTEWLHQLQEKPKDKNVKKILKFIPAQGLFSCFLAAQKKTSITRLLIEYMGTEPGSLRQLPLSGGGEPFDGRSAKLMFDDRMDEIREMAGDPEWSVRYFSIKLLLNEESDRSKRVILEAFSDPHPLVRKSVIEESIIDNRVKIYDLLKEHLLDDPSFEVRESAYKRITADFKDIHRIDYSSLTVVQSLHSLEFLDPDIENDIDAALNFLEGDDLELRFPSAIFLQEIKTLGKMLKKVSFEDTKNLNRTTKLLTNAAEVKTTGFLGEGIYTPAALYTALLLLKETGERKYISEYALKVFENNTEYNEKIWQSAVECISKRGNEDAVKILLKELSKVKYKNTQADFILKNLPANIEFLSFDILMDLLKDSDFSSREALTDAVSAMPEDVVLPELFGILKAGRTAFSHKIRITALQILARYKLPYCLQPIIEQLPTLPVTEAKEFSA
ncbi:MAG: HEAT repeat domain-containing protein, partial [Spirochaetales bacterium]|nr:HEAT repeat domain-containing protein [Spirochaetales bacterium]